MLRGAIGRQRQTTSQMCHLLVFSVGGRRLAARTEEIGGISAWMGSIAVPSRTPFIFSVIRRDQAVFPVFDLAGMLKVRVRGEHLLCLMVKQPEGGMAICIDAEMPVLHSINRAHIPAYRTQEFETVGSFNDEFEDVPIISIARLGSA